MKKQNSSLIDSIKAANSKISILTEEVGSHNVEKMREFYKKPELSGKFFYQMGQIKGSSDSSHLIFGIRATLNLTHLIKKLTR